MSAAGWLTMAQPAQVAHPAPDNAEACVILLDGDHPSALQTRGRLQAAGIEVLIGVEQSGDGPVALVLHAESLRRDPVATRMRQARRQFGEPPVWVITGLAGDRRATLPGGSAADMLELRDRMVAAGIGFVTLDPVGCDARG